MKVVCIRDDWEGDYEAGIPAPIFGEIYTVIETRQDNEDGYAWYHNLQGFEGWWEVCGFAPISNIDEKHFERNYNKELV